MKDSGQLGESDSPLSRTNAQNRSIGSDGNPRAGTLNSHSRSAWTYVKWAIAASICTFVMAVGAIAGNLYWHIKWPVNDGKPHIALRPLTMFNLNNFPADKQHGMNILIMGCDHDYYDNKPLPILTTPGRSDALMIAHVDFDKGTISVLSIPRDTAVHVPGYRGVKKINSAHSFGGAQLSKATVKSVFGIDTDYYVGLNYEGFQQLVDAIGGVDLVIDKQLDYDDNWGHLHVHLKPGAQHLDGYKAMGYVRIRHTDDDFHRQERQHAFLLALQQQILSVKTLTKIPDALNAITNNLDTDMNPNQLMTVGYFARGLSKDGIVLSTMPSKMGRSFVFIDKPKTAEVVRKIFFADDRFASIEINAPDVARVAGTRKGLAFKSVRRRRHHAASVIGDPGIAPAIDQTTPPADSPGSSDSGGSSGGTGGGSTETPTGPGAGGVQNGVQMSNS